MSTESYLWTKLKKIPEADMTRHEDKLNYGIPDVSFGVRGVNGWIELKAFKKRPTRGVYKFNNLQNTQVRFLEHRGRAGGNCFLMLVINRNKEAEYFLFHWSVVRKLYKTSLSWSMLNDLCCYWSYSNLNYRKLRNVLMANQYDIPTCPY